jgi:hypothetical protein
MPNLTDEEIALLKHYRKGERIVTEPQRSKAQQRLTGPQIDGGAVRDNG